MQNVLTGSTCQYILRQIHSYGSIITVYMLQNSSIYTVMSMYFPRLEDLRIDNDKTQIAIADYLNMNREVYRRYEKGIREIPVWALIKLAGSTAYLRTISSA